MTASSLFAYDRSGSYIVIGDGTEVLVHSGADESPLWRKQCEAALVGVASVGGAVITLDADGRLTWWNGSDGERGETVSLGATPRAFAAATDGTCAVTLPDAVAIVQRAETKRSLLVANAGAVAFSDDGARLAVGTDDGRVRVYPTVADEPQGTAEIGFPVRSLGWNAGGFWLATGGDRVFRVEADARAGAQITQATGTTPDCVACSADGSLFSLRLDPSLLVLLAYPSKDTAATLRYIDRRIVGVAFGPAPYVGVGIDTGDGNKINLATESVHRTDTHPGRSHNRWMLSCAIEQPALPAAYRSFGGGAGQRPGATSGGAEKAGSSGTTQILLAVGLLVIGAVVLLSRCQ